MEPLKTPTSAAAILVLAIGLVSTACGRDRLASCDSDDECAAGELCLEGQCTPAGVDVGADAEESDGETPDNDTCAVRCSEWQEATPDCECEPKSCESSTTCGDFPCVEGQCAQCSDDGQCDGDLVCAEDGRCLEGQACETNADCPARQKCNDAGECVDRTGCLTDEDCDGDSEICFNGQCTYSPECEEDGDCREGMECVGGQCYEAICRGNDECSGEKVCNAGECELPPEAERCIVASQDGKIAEDERVKLEAFALDGDGNGVPADFEWSSTKPSVASIGSSGNWAVGGSESGETEITASIVDSDVDCDGTLDLTNLGEVSEEQVRLVVTDANKKSPVSGAEVVVAGNSSETDDAGVATVAQPEGEFTVSVYHDDYNWVTIQDVQSTDLRVPLRRREGEGPISGFSGKFDTSQLNTSGDVTIGLAGSSITGGLLEVGVEELLGPPYLREITTPQGEQEVPVNSGLVVTGELGLADIKEKYYARSRGGPRLGWGMAGQLETQELLSEFRNGVGDNFLATLLQLFNRFDHGNRPLTLQERPRVEDSDDLDGDGDTSEMIPDWEELPTVDLAPYVRQNLVTEVTVSNFPELDSGEAEIAVLVGGVLSDSAGFVPLGISAATDENGDGDPDLQNLSVAPPYGSLTGSRYAVMALAFNTESFGTESGLTLPDDLSVALWTRQSLPSRVGLGTFPDTSAGSVDADNRQIDIETDAGPMYRVQMVGENRTWELWTTGPAGSQGSYSASISVPEPHGDRDDLLEGAKVVVDAVEVDVTLDDLVKASGIGLRRLGIVATSFNRSTLEQ